MKNLLAILFLAIPAALFAQSGAQGSGPPGPPSGFFPWWDSPMVKGLDLTDAQRTQIRSVTREYRGRMREVLNAVQKAEGDLEAVFNEETVDQRRGAEAIDRLSKARAEMTKSVSEMSLRMRAVLTSQQWQDLQKRQREQGAPGIQNVGRGRRGPKNGPKSVTKNAPQRADAPALPPPPALSQQQFTQK